ncbi:MAG TPA: isoleucine--tRNA ligase [Acidimicrobiales bacterium]|nr:isoleucine--tRNA ligase [Acidimicrobiales bacterium]
MTFGPIDPQVNFVELERRVLARWRDSDLVAAVASRHTGEPPWVFYEGPPTANGRPGIHHVWGRVFKDLFPRFRTMQGHDVPRKGGWDCHGLPVEIEIEKELGFTHKDQIEEYGIDRFNQRCRESVHTYVEDWAALTERSGVWIDTKGAYWTLSNDYIESVWWLLKQLFDAGLLYEGHRVSPYCPRCGTALSSHELGQPGAYKEVTDASVYVRFPLIDDDADLVVWTTTPWTLISNVAVAVGADIEYVRVPGGDGARDLIVAAERVESVLGDVDLDRARFPGRQLVGRRYRRPFDFLPIDERGERVVAASFVSTDDGSGIVHLAPAFGADDMEVAKAEDLPVLNPVDARGTFDERIVPWAGRPVKGVDQEVVTALTERGILLRQEPFTHAYPHCWRCGTPLIYWAKTSWFVRTSEHKNDLIRENERVNWHPEHIKHGRFGDWLENNVDWALSRDRYWGTPLPIWRCTGGHDTCVGSVAELSRLAERDLGALDLHRPFVDEVELACPVTGCSAPARRLLPVLDAWFDSGAMPSAQQHFPFETRDAQKPELFPADFICEAIDQTRGWFYSLLAINALVFGESPYRNVVCHAHIVDQDGQKMSKSKGNVIDPWDVIDTFGADALRWYLVSAGSPWTSRRVYNDGIREASRKTLVTLWNVVSFFATYADIDGWLPDAPSSRPVPQHVLDIWALARLDKTVAEVTQALEGFDALGAATALAGFVDDLSNWYVRRSRSRFWGDRDSNAYATLHHCLVITSQLLAPFCPFLADEVYVVLTGEPSVHLTDWPVAGGVEENTIATMSAARALVSLGRSARVDARMPVRQPLRRALLLHPGVELNDAVRQEIAEELNVKRLEDVDNLSDLEAWTVVPNFRTLGPRLGPKVNAVKRALADLDGAEVRAALESDGFVVVAGERLEPGDVELRADRHEDFALVQDGGWAVALDLELDDALRLEGSARQLARAVNEMRKNLDLDLTDRIVVRIYSAGPKLRGAVEAHRKWIAGEVLATEVIIDEGEPSSGGSELEIDGEPVWVELNLSASS